LILISLRSVQSLSQLPAKKQAQDLIVAGMIHIKLVRSSAVELRRYRCYLMANEAAVTPV